MFREGPIVIKVQVPGRFELRRVCLRVRPLSLRMIRPCKSRYYQHRVFDSGVHNREKPCKTGRCRVVQASDKENSVDIRREAQLLHASTDCSWSPSPL